jgi:glycosyltransferase involved in cell wall biosynthesis
VNPDTEKGIEVKAVCSPSHEQAAIAAIPSSVMRVAMLDPSAFTIPYDIHLCRGLLQTGVDVELYTRAPRKSDYFTYAEDHVTGIDQEPHRLSIFNYFYKFTDNLNLFGRAPRVRYLLKAVEHAANMRTLALRLSQQSQTVVHFQWMVLPLFDRVFIKRIKKIAPIVLTVHDTNAFHAPTSRLQLISWLSAVKEFHRLIVHTKQAKQTLIVKGVEENKIAVVPHGVLKYDDSSATVAGTHDDSSQLVLLMFGSLKWYKGLDVLIRALAKLSTVDRAQIRLIVAGKPNLPEAELHNLAVECEVDNCIDWHLRFITDSEIPIFFQRCDVVVFPYRQIDASGALMTALPYGKAIVASRVGVFDELLTHEKDALLVRPGDTESLAAALRKLLQDRQLARTLGRHSALLAERALSWESIAKLTLEVYNAAALHKSAPD